MSKRLQVLLDEEEFETYQGMAEVQGRTLASWVREALREAGRKAPVRAQREKLAAVEEAMAFAAPAAGVDEMKREMFEGALRSIDAGLPEPEI